MLFTVNKHVHFNVLQSERGFKLKSLKWKSLKWKSLKWKRSQM